MTDGSAIRVTINGITACHVVLDLGASEPMIHERMVKAGQILVDPNGRRITGITSQPHMMPRTIETLEVVIRPNDSVREAVAVDSMGVMFGETLPDCLFDNEMMAQIGIVVDPATWTASYPSRSNKRDSPRIIVPLVHPSLGSFGTPSTCRGLCRMGWRRYRRRARRQRHSAVRHGFSGEHLLHGDPYPYRFSSYQP